MKRFFVLLLVIAMVFTMAGCGSSKNDNKGESDAKPQDQQQEIEKITFKYGRVNNGVYENDIVGIGFRFGEYGLEEEEMGAYRDRTPAEEIAKNMLGTLVVELHCKNKDLVDADGNLRIFMQVTINVQESADKLQDYMKANIDHTMEQYTSGKDFYAGYTVSDNKQFSGKIGDKNFEGAEFTIHDSTFGTNIVERRYFARYGQYIYRITFMASDSDFASTHEQLRAEIDKLISGYFYKL